ncbi:hypothetical protein CEXT_734031 [Caerostris extrusa]|uniref:Uncharacterized protein n=1 Tax=Caerostris extrusa TaxID=172846 RepID=A0AAV4XFG7_CAEEX|nr:hypothetical protein CEXT_734031 [Caerostris extrusa]
MDVNRLFSSWCISNRAEAHSQFFDFSKQLLAQFVAKKDKKQRKTYLTNILIVRLCDGHCLARQSLHIKTTVPSPPPPCPMWVKAQDN